MINPHVYFSREIYQSLPDRLPIHLALFTDSYFKDSVPGNFLIFLVAFDRFYIRGMYSSENIVSTLPQIFFHAPITGLYISILRLFLCVLYSISEVSHGFCRKKVGVSLL
jgi:hypothetical protein